MALFGLIKERQVPSVEELTVSRYLASQLGFKSKGSSYWLVMDPGRVDPDDLRSNPAASFVTKQLCNRDSSFRGVYCYAGIESISDITADLQKYCKMVNQPGMVYCNGERIDVNAKGEIVKLQTSQARSAGLDTGPDI